MRQHFAVELLPRAEVGNVKRARKLLAEIDTRPYFRQPEADANWIGDSARDAKGDDDETGREREHSVTGAIRVSRLKNLYVIRLDKAVLEEPKFRKETPSYRPWKPCVYVGATSLDPEERFRQHKTGYKAGRGYVTKYGKYLMPRKYKRLNPVPSAEADDRERDLAESLRRKGYGVWQR